MRNVLFISYAKHNLLGGTQEYNYLLFEKILDINFFEFPICWPKNKSTKSEIESVTTYTDLCDYEDYIDDHITIPKFLYNSKIKIAKRLSLVLINRRRNCKNITEKLEKIISNNNITNIVLTTSWYYDKKFLLKHKDKIIFVQHNNPFYYYPNYRFSYKKGKYIKWNIFFLIAFNFLNIYHNPFKYVNNIIAYDEENIKIIRNDYKNIQNWYIVNLPTTFRTSNKNNKIKKKYNFISPIRLEKAKNVSQLVDFAILNPNLKFVVCGDGSEKYKLNDIKNITHLGTLNKDELLKVYKKSRFLILFSFFEGFSFAITEAFSLGIPCIVANTFPSAKYLIGNNNERGFLFDLNDKNYNMKILNYINQINYKKTSNNCLEFAKERLSIDVFIDKWKNILDIK